MTEQQRIQVDGAGALDLNKLPEMQQQPGPQGDGEQANELEEDDSSTSSKREDGSGEVYDGVMPNEDPQMGVAMDNG